MMPMPLLFDPIFKEKVWGGRALEKLGKTLPPEKPIGESWELADLPVSIPDGRSRIANGPLAGQTLRQAIALHREWILGSARLTPQGGFPLLIKYLDARENLSVQVHPDAAYARRHPGAHVKSEAWYVVDAEPGAVIYRGLKPEVTREAFRSHLEDDRIVDDLIVQPVRAGDCINLPSGIVHALGAGVVVAEVQTPSDTTFRLYDWGRDGRTMHIEEALTCVQFGAPPPTRAQPPLRMGGLSTRPLLRTRDFGLELLEASTDATLEIVTSNMPEIWMILSGSGRIESRGRPMMHLEIGQTVLLPAHLERVEPSAVLPGGFRGLRVSLPSPLEGLIA